MQYTHHLPATFTSQPSTFSADQRACLPWQQVSGRWSHACISRSDNRMPACHGADREIIHDPAPIHPEIPVAFAIYPSTLRYLSLTQFSHHLQPGPDFGTSPLEAANQGRKLRAAKYKAQLTARTSAATIHIARPRQRNATRHPELPAFSLPRKHPPHMTAAHVTYRHHRPHPPPPLAHRMTGKRRLPCLAITQNTVSSTSPC